MRTNLAQYYLSFSENVPTHLINILNTGERQIFKLNPEELALRDLGIYVTNKINYRSIVDQIKQLVMSNNTLGMNISDIVDILGTQSYNKLQDSIKKIEERRMKEQQMELEQKRKELLEINRLNMEEKRLKYEYDKAIEELKARYRLLEAQLKSYALSTRDINENRIPDVYDLQQMLKATKEYKEELENTDKYFRETIERQQKLIDELKNKSNESKGG
jgi:chromosome segregation ATPase